MLRAESNNSRPPVTSQCHFALSKTLPKINPGNEFKVIKDHFKDQTLLHAVINNTKLQRGKIAVLFFVLPALLCFLSVFFPPFYRQQEKHTVLYQLESTIACWESRGHTPHPSGLVFGKTSRITEA